MKKNIFLASIIFSLSISQIYAFDAKLEVDKNKITADDRVTLHITIENATEGNFDVEKIEGLDNFDIVGKSQSSSFSSINGKTTSNIAVDISLSPKKKGKYTLGPVTVSDGKTTQKTKSVELEVTGEKMFIGGGNNISPNPIPSAGVQNLPGALQEEFSPDTNPPPDDYSKIIILAGLVIVMTLMVYLALNRIKHPTGKPEEVVSGPEEKLPIVSLPEVIEYPTLTDKEFIRKIETIFKQKLCVKYHISSLENKNHSEILSEIGERNEEIEEIFELLQKAKYSNLIVNNEQILEKITNFNV